MFYAEIKIKGSTKWMLKHLSLFKNLKTTVTDDLIQITGETEEVDFGLNGFEMYIVRPYNFLIKTKSSAPVESAVYQYIKDNVSYLYGWANDTLDNPEPIFRNVLKIKGADTQLGQIVAFSEQKLKFTEATQNKPAEAVLTA